MAITLTLVLVAVRLTVELDAIDRIDAFNRE